MIAQLFGVLKSLGVERFDFGGLAPGSPGAAGVDHFKRGFGGDTIEYLGEWEWARSRMIQRAANYLIGRRRTW
jgi:lipid II:glycine glycyltransferase (peptidoglycan interpeptide bridge formation enzyme)